MRRTMVVAALAVWALFTLFAGAGMAADAATAGRDVEVEHVVAAVAPLAAGGVAMLASNAVESTRDRGRVRRARQK